PQDNLGGDWEEQDLRLRRADGVRVLLRALPAAALLRGAAEPRRRQADGDGGVQRAHRRGAAGGRRELAREDDREGHLREGRAGTVVVWTSDGGVVGLEYLRCTARGPERGLLRRGDAPVVEAIRAPVRHAPPRRYRHRRVDGDPDQRRRRDRLDRRP